MAIKLIKRPIPKAALAVIKREIKIQADLGQGHLNIVSADEVILTRTYLGLIMEYVPGMVVCVWWGGGATARPCMPCGCHGHRMVPSARCVHEDCQQQQERSRPVGPDASQLWPCIPKTHAAGMHVAPMWPSAGGRSALPVARRVQVATWWPT